MAPRTMNTEFELTLLYANRVKLLAIMDSMPDEKLLLVPMGFNNNVLWHIGHCVASQQRLLYMRSGLPLNVSELYNSNFKIDTSPQTWTSVPDIQEVKNSLLTTFEQLKEDLKEEIFKTYEPMKSSMGFTVSNHLEALAYNNFHEAEHAGYAKFLVKLIG